jgi:hypothetical protein
VRENDRSAARHRNAQAAGKRDSVHLYGNFDVSGGGVRGNHGAEFFPGCPYSENRETAPINGELMVRTLTAVNDELMAHAASGSECHNKSGRTSPALIRLSARYSIDEHSRRGSED